MKNSDWLEEQLGDVDDDYILFDCPGQIELYTHMTVMRQLVEMLQQRWNFRVCGVFLLDSQFMVDGAKFLSGTMAALSVMVNLELPHINILAKMDLLSKGARNQLDRLVISECCKQLHFILNDFSLEVNIKKILKLTVTAFVHVLTHLFIGILFYDAFFSN
jgi:GTPase SAR1 family protein